jgi:hypothetical protein
MRKLMLLLIAFIAVVTFIRAFDKTGPEAPALPGQTSSLQGIESGTEN